ncbi:MAG: hypothetical protein M1823_004629 [Watsoniomyces obsoletus]|nr:MAG: hypothetical protein M1823_004629 [Watsoniomyces obsoletus]
MSDVKENNNTGDTKIQDPDEAASSSARHPPPSVEVEDVPDPDEDYLDDLDDVLEEFSAPPKSDVKTQEPSISSNHGGKDTSTKRPSAEEDDEFAKELEAGMADLLDELAETPEVRQQLENLVKDLGQAAGAVGGSSGEGPAGGISRSEEPTTERETGTAGGSFQDTIKRTMRRMQESNEQATAATTTTTSDDPEDVLAEMLKQVQTSSSGEGGGGTDGTDDNEEEFSKLLVGMMEQLTTKEILYAPMTELNEKFPAWMEKNAEKVSEEDRGRYQEQRRLVGEIVARFERENYSDKNPEDREYIVERMQKMQAAGAPPAELVGNVDAAQGALDDLDAACPQQ